MADHATDVIVIGGGIAGICAALGWPHADQADTAAAWQRIRSTVRDWTDLEPALIGRVEELIDFVTSTE